MSLADLLPHVISALAGGIGVYAGIRADLAALHARVALLETSANQAHIRIDKLLER